MVYENSILLLKWGLLSGRLLCRSFQLASQPPCCPSISPHLTLHTLNTELLQHFSQNRRSASTLCIWLASGMAWGQAPSFLCSFWFFLSPLSTPVHRDCSGFQVLLPLFAECEAVLYTGVEAEMLGAASRSPPSTAFVLTPSSLRPSVNVDRMAVPGMAEEWPSCEPRGGGAPQGHVEPPSQSWVAFLCTFIYVREGSFHVVSATATLGPCFSWLNPLPSEVAGFSASGPARPVMAATGWRGAGSLWGLWGAGHG